MKNYLEIIIKDSSLISSFYEVMSEGITKRTSISDKNLTKILTNNLNKVSLSEDYSIINIEKSNLNFKLFVKNISTKTTNPECSLKSIYIKFNHLINKFEIQEIELIKKIKNENIKEIEIIYKISKEKIYLIVMQSEGGIVTFEMNKNHSYIYNFSEPQKESDIYPMLDFVFCEKDIRDNNLNNVLLDNILLKKEISEEVCDLILLNYDFNIAKYKNENSRINIIDINKNQKTRKIVNKIYEGKI